MPTRLFGYRAGMSTAALGGTFGRASMKMIPDASGTLVSVGSGVLADGDYIGGKRYVLLEGARTNLVTRSEPTVAQLGSSGGSPTNAAGAYGFSSGIGFPAGATQVWGYHTGLCAINTQYVLSVFLVMADGSAPRVGATSAASEDLSLLIAGSTVPALSCTVTQIAGSLYRATAVVTTGGTIGANNVGVVRQTTHSGKAFTIYGYQLEAAAFASSYTPTTGSTATRAADSLSFGYTPVPQAMTVLARTVEIGATPPTGSARVFQIGTSATARLMLARTAANTWTATHHNGTSSVTSAVTVTPAVGDLCDFRVVLNSDGSVQLGVAVNGSETLGTASAALTLAGAWSATTLALGSAVGGGSEGFIALGSTVAASGAQSLATMQAMVSALGPTRRRRSAVLLAGGAG